MQKHNELSYLEFTTGLSNWTTQYNVGREEAERVYVFYLEHGVSNECRD